MQAQLSNIIKIIDNAIITESSDKTVIDDTDILIDVLDYYANTTKIQWPSHIINLDKVNVNVLVHELKTHLANSPKTIDIIEYIDAQINNKCYKELNNFTLTNIDQIIDVLEHFEKKYKLKIPIRLTEKPTLKYLTDELKTLYHTQIKFEYIIIYAKMFENKQSKEMIVEGPYFGEQAQTQEEIDIKAAELVEKQQSNALLIKIYKRNDRSDLEIMTHAKKHFSRIHKEIEANK